MSLVLSFFRLRVGRCCCGEDVGIKCSGIGSVHIESVCFFGVVIIGGGGVGSGIGDEDGSRCCGSGVDHSSSSVAAASFGFVCFFGVL